MNTKSRSNAVLALTAATRGGTYQSTTLYFEWENEKWRENPK